MLTCACPNIKLGPSPLKGLSTALLPEPYEIFVPSAEALSLVAWPLVVAGDGTQVDVSVSEPLWTFIVGCGIVLSC